MREPNVVALVWICKRGEVLSRSRLHLLDEDVSGGAGHSLTLLVGHDRVVSPDLDVCEFWRGGDVGTDDWHDRGVRVEDGDAVVEDEQLVPVTEVKRDAHLVVGQCSGGKGHTGVASKEEGKRKIEIYISRGLR